MKQSIDILMITYNRLAHTQMTLPNLLDTVDEHCRVWIWQNGSDPDTLAYVRSVADDPRIYAFKHSTENLLLNAPTNWLFSNGDGAYVAKVDDDCMVPADWITRLRELHALEPRFGALGCWHFQEEDFNPPLAEKKIQTFAGGAKLLRNPWIGGSGYLMKRECVEQAGLLTDSQTFTDYCLDLALKGWVNGFPIPLIEQIHLDDPRAKPSLVQSESDFQKAMPLSARRLGANSLEQWDRQLRRSALTLQTCPWQANSYVGWRGRLRRVLTRFARLVSRR